MRVPRNICPACHAPLDGASQVDGDHGPRAGDLSICVYCGNLGIFQADLSLRDLTVAELEVVRQDKQVQRILRLRYEHFGDDGTAQ